MEKLAEISVRYHDLLSQRSRLCDETFPKVWDLKKDTIIRVDEGEVIGRWGRTGGWSVQSVCVNKSVLRDKVDMKDRIVSWIINTLDFPKTSRRLPTLDGSLTGARPLLCHVSVEWWASRPCKRSWLVRSVHSGTEMLSCSIRLPHGGLHFFDLMSCHNWTSHHVCISPPVLPIMSHSEMLYMYLVDGCDKM